MFARVNLAAIVAAAGLASSAPAPSGPGQGTFTLEQVPNEKFEPNALSILARDYRKHGKPLPQGLEKALESSVLAQRSSGSTGTGDGTPYVVTVSVGNPPRNLSLLHDTGSADLWVFGPELPDYQLEIHPYYDPAASDTSEELSGHTWFVKYGSGKTASGNVYLDTVTIAGVTYDNQSVEVAKEIGGGFEYVEEYDGILGLGFSNHNKVKPQAQKTFFDNIVPSLDAPVFTADLKYHEPGRFDFGFIDDSLYSGSIAYAPVNSSGGYWTFTTGGYAIASGSFQAVPWSGFADTGTSLSYMPEDIMEEYYSTIPGSAYQGLFNAYSFPCDTPNPPDFTFGVGDVRITLPGSSLSIGSIVVGGNICLGSIQPNVGLDFTVFGASLLQAAFVVFDATPKIGFASKPL